jgi:hypothetical protein
MKRFSYKLKQELLRFRDTHSWSETCKAFNHINEKTWAQWIKNREKILGSADLSEKEKAEKRKQDGRKWKEHYKITNPDKVVSAVMRKVHPLVVCTYHANGNFKRYRSKNKAPFTKLLAFDLWKIAKKQKMKCPLTGLVLTADIISADHIIPVSKGGTNLSSNIRLVHKTINHMKNHYSDQEFLKMCSLVANHFQPIT